MRETQRQLAAELLGTAMLLATIVGSGIMAERLAGGNVALALLCNAIATGAMLAVLILVWGPVSGAHFNPAVSAAAWLRNEMSWRRATGFASAQVIGAVGGTLLAHLMFDVPTLQMGSIERAGIGQLVAEVAATFGLVLTIIGTGRSEPKAIPYAVGLYITAAYWFTSSTSFANPAVTIARAFTGTFAGIRPLDVPAFLLAQFAGMLIAVGVARLFWPPPATFDTA